MSAFNWFKKCFNPYVNFKGRACLKEYWYFYLFCSVFGLAAMMIDYIIYGVSVSSGAVMSNSGPKLIFSMLYSLAILLPSMGAMVRRLHDTGRSGWWLLISLIPFVGLIILFVFLVQAGTPAANKYGEDPKKLEETQQ